MQIWLFCFESVFESQRVQAACKCCVAVTGCLVDNILIQMEYIFYQNSDWFA